MRCKLLLVEGIHQSYTQDMEVISSKDFVALICFTLATLLISFIVTTCFAALLPNQGAVTKILYGFPISQHKSKTPVTAHQRKKQLKLKYISTELGAFSWMKLLGEIALVGKGQSEDTLSK